MSMELETKTKHKITKKKINQGIIIKERKKNIKKDNA